METIVNFKQSYTNIFIIALFPPSILSLPHILPPFPFAVRLTFSLVSQHTSSCGLNRKRAEALFFVCKFVVKSLVRSCLLLSNTIDKIVGEGPSTVYFVHLSVQETGIRVGSLCAPIVPWSTCATWSNFNCSVR